MALYVTHYVVAHFHYGLTIIFAVSHGFFPYQRADATTDWKECMCPVGGEYEGRKYDILLCLSVFLIFAVKSF